MVGDIWEQPGPAAFPCPRSCCDRSSLTASSAVSCPRSLLVSQDREQHCLCQGSTVRCARAWDRSTAGTGACGDGHRAAELPDPSMRRGRAETLGKWGMATPAEPWCFLCLAPSRFVSFIFISSPAVSPFPLWHRAVLPTLPVSHTLLTPAGLITKKGGMEEYYCFLQLLTKRCREAGANVC